MNLKTFCTTTAPRFILMALILTGCASNDQLHATDPQPAIIFHQSDEVLSPRLKDAKSFAHYVQEIQSECDSYYSRAKPRNPQTVDVVVVIKPGKKSRFWLAYDQPQSNPAPDKRLLQRLGRIAVPGVEQGPVSFSVRLLLWGAREPNPQTARAMILPTEWRDAMGTNRVVLPDGILPKIWPE